MDGEVGVRAFYPYWILPVKWYSEGIQERPGGCEICGKENPVFMGTTDLSAVSETKRLQLAIVFLAQSICGLCFCNPGNPLMSGVSGEGNVKKEMVSLWLPDVILLMRSGLPLSFLILLLFLFFAFKLNTTCLYRFNWGQLLHLACVNL